VNRNGIKAEEVQKLREKLGENQTDFAKRFGISQQAVSHWETGRKGLSGPAVKLFKLYCKLYQKM